MKLIVSTELSCQPKEWLLKVVVGLGRNIIILKVLLSVEGNLLGFDFAVFDFDLVSSEYNGDIFADPSQITVPVGNIFVRDTRGNIKHDNSTLSLDVVTITKPSEFLSQKKDGMNELSERVSDEVGKC